MECLLSLYDDVIKNIVLIIQGYRPYRYNPEWVQNVWQTVRPSSEDHRC